MKATKNFYWGGIWYKVGDEAPEDAPAFLTDGEPAPQAKAKKTVKTGSKKADPVQEDKNGAPQTEDKAPKRRKKSK